jgi:hypothetical protein
MTLISAPGSTLRVRPAIPQDIDSMATIIYEAMPMDPQWDYRFPLRKKYPEDNYAYTRLMMKSMLEEDGVFTQVVTFPTPGLRVRDEVPAAVAVWEVTFNPDKDYSVPASEFLPFLPSHEKKNNIKDRTMGSFINAYVLLGGDRRRWWTATRRQLRAHGGF